MCETKLFSFCGGSKSKKKSLNIKFNEKNKKMLWKHLGVMLFRVQGAEEDFHGAAGDGSTKNNHFEPTFYQALFFPCSLENKQI